MAIEAVRNIGPAQGYTVQPTERVNASDAGAAVAEEAYEPSAQTAAESFGSEATIQEIDGEDNVEQDNERIKKAVSDLNKKISSNSEAVFGIHEKTNRITIKIVEKDSKKVIKEFPPDKTLDMIAKVWELAGIMVDEKR